MKSSRAVLLSIGVYLYVYPMLALSDVRLFRHKKNDYLATKAYLNDNCI